MKQPTDELRKTREHPALDVLVVAPAAAERQAFVSALETAGHRVRSAEDGIAAVRDLLQSYPDAVVIDIELPRLDGLLTARLMRALEAEGARIPIVAIVSASTPSSGNPQQAADIDACITKPVDQDTLEHLVVEQWAASPRAAALPGASVPSTVEAQPAPNFAAALERLGGDRKLLDDLIGFFFEDAYPLLGALHDALAQRNADAARRAAHSLKGLSANFGATKAVAALQAIESLSEVPDSGKQSLEVDVDREIARLTAALANYADKTHSS